MLNKIKIQIKSIWGNVLFEYSKKDNTIKDTLVEAVKRGANLRGANLQEANLRGANLRGANLWGAKNLSPIYQSDLSILKYQKGKIKAFKFLEGDKSPMHEDKITYKVGKTYLLKQDKCDFDEYVLCGAGLNVATLNWCLRETGCNLDKTYIEVEFTANDIIAIPYNSDGKFRVKKLKVIKKLTKKELEKYLKVEICTLT